MGALDGFRPTPRTCPDAGRAGHRARASWSPGL